ncbi:MAG: cytochrome c [Azoarcus sp.]|nr:cytochrome c [Azoarcus sp.]
MQRLISLAALVLFTLSACNSSPEDDRPGQPVKHRQEAFKVLLRAFEPIGTMLHDESFDAERLASLNTALAQAREAPWAYFGPDTDYPPSKSRPEVWSQPERFEAERQRFFAATDALAAATGREAVEAAYREARASCKTCHDAFRR